MLLHMLLPQECVSEGDSSPLFAAARAVMRLQSMFGLIPRLTVRPAVMYCFAWTICMCCACAGSACLHLCCWALRLPAEH